jgi:hypothetical protein
MALQLYTLALVYVNGSLLAEEADVSVDRDARAQEVATVAKGFAGLSPGAAITKIDVTNAVPSAGFELNPGAFIKQLAVVELTILAAGQTLTAKGFIPQDTFQHGVSKEASLRFAFIGEPVDWK